MKPSKFTKMKSASEIGYNYVTIKITQSRINKGLLAIPISLINWFPKYNCQLKVFFDDSPIIQIKNFTPYNSSSHECRIGGLAEWFKKNRAKDGDEIVVQIIDKKKSIYKLILESKFVKVVKKAQDKLDNSESEKEVNRNLIEIANWTRNNEEIVKLSEFYRLAKENNAERKQIIIKEKCGKENTPVNLKVLIGKIYLGYCQVCDFWFLKKNGVPYYEIHHIEPKLGNSPQNLLSVCGNCHNQFTFADVKQEFKEGWLSKVYFNDNEFKVNQIVFTKKITEALKEVFIFQ